MVEQKMLDVQKKIYSWNLKYVKYVFKPVYFVFVLIRVYFMHNFACTFAMYIVSCNVSNAARENQHSAYAKTKAQISFAVTAKLISAFVFAT